MTKISAKQAETDPELVSYGHIFPAGLALRIAQAYAYKYGISNKLWTHKGQYNVNEEGSEEEVNTQPYLEDFKQLGLQWVTTMKPTGKTYTTGAIITTSAINGATRIWFTSNTSTLISAGRAVEIVRGQSGLGVVFADAGAEDSGGKYFAIEPRQIFPAGHGLEYLVSVVPSTETRTTLNVIVDAHTQSVVAVFQPNAAGDADLVNYLSTGVLPANEQFNGSGAGNTTGLSSTPTQETGKTPTSPVATSPAAASNTVATIKRLLQENKSSQSGLQAEQRNLESLLAAAEKAAKH